METDTLSNYKSNINMQLLQDSVDKTCLKNGSGLHEQNSCDTSDEPGNDNVHLENKSKEPKDAEWTKDCSETENHSKEDDTFDSDVEEEHVPLNIATTSDIEKSDDDLDESNEPSNTFDSEKEENCKTDYSSYKVSDPLETNDVKESEQTEVPSNVKIKLDRNLTEVELPQEIFNVNDVNPSKTDESNNIGSNEPMLENKVENDNDENVISELNQKDINNDEKHIKNDEKDIENDEKEAKNDEKDVKNYDEIKNNEKEDPLEKKVCEESSSDKIIKSPETDNKGEDIINDNSVELSESEKDKNNGEKVQELKEDAPELKGEHEVKEDKHELKGNEHKLLSETKSGNETTELSSEKEIEVKSQETINKLILENEIKEKTNEKVLETKTGESSNKKESCSLLMQTLTKKSDKDCESEEDNREDEMDEAYFDPSLLCPDISMEVDEDPVITTNDAPPPPQDGNKSPVLYEPIFSTYVDEMTGAEVSLNLSLEEEALRHETYGEKNPVQFTKIHCTACNVHLGSALDGQGNRFVHPLLKVLICKNCYHFYTSGEFEKDEDGSELYCRWCGQGGQVMCCSNCEMVFCKKCIRINFDRKKLADIRDSDDWLCFRCNPSQLTFQRIHCAEFMEYVRREISRAATLDNATAFMTTDNSQCCVTQKKKATETPTGEPKKKKRKVPTDPDYDPFKDREETESPQPSTSGTSSIPSKPTGSQKTPNIVSYVQNQADAINKQIDGTPGSSNSNSTSFKIGSTTFSARTPNINQVRPKYQVLTPVSNNTAQRHKISGPGYIKILPGGIRVPGNTPTPRNTAYTSRQVQGTAQPSSAQLKQTLLSVQPKQQTVRNAQTTSMKHEWFEKTVRAAARVNSNLSYTLTQLNRAQANAQSVEALAVVHNKLQEILSTSINSLIQIRKNLRTEFIAGIKNIRFPPAAAKSSPATPAQAQKPSTSTDDDVIFISPPTSPVPSPLTQKPTTSGVTTLNLPASVSLVKKPAIPSTSTSTLKVNASTTPVSTSSSEPNGDRLKSFLRVKSLAALQNVPSECITIPDDPLPSPPPLTLIQNIENSTVSDTSEVIDKNSENADIVEIIDDNKEDSDINNKENSLVNGIAEGSSDNLNSGQRITYNLKEPPSTELNKIMSDIKIILEKSTKIDELVKSKFNQINDDMSD